MVFEIYVRFADGSVAQLVEHRTFNPRALGSSPSRPTGAPQSLTGLRRIFVSGAVPPILPLVGQSNTKSGSSGIAPAGSTPLEQNCAGGSGDPAGAARAAPRRLRVRAPGAEGEYSPPTLQVLSSRIRYNTPLEVRETPARNSGQGRRYGCVVAQFLWTMAGSAAARVVVLAGWTMAAAQRRGWIACASERNSLPLPPPPFPATPQPLLPPAQPPPTTSSPAAATLGPPLLGQSLARFSDPPQRLHFGQGKTEVQPRPPIPESRPPNAECQPPNAGPQSRP